MVGDLADFVSRLWVVLPRRWFAERSPNIDALLVGIATPWVWLFGLVSYVIRQSRLSTATDEWIDLIAIDYFGNNLIRRANESDPNYRGRIRRTLFREAATRAAVSAGLMDLIGTKPTIFEPANCLDTGCYETLKGNSRIIGVGLAYGHAGGWGSLGLPFQFFVTAARLATPGVSALAGYGTSSGGYGEGAISYVDLTLLPGHVTDADIRATLCSLVPVTAVAWLRIT